MSELLDLVLSAHGGLERWREVQTIDLKLSITWSRVGLREQDWEYR
jgi:hypothetical protein